MEMQDLMVRTKQQRTAQGTNNVNRKLPFAFGFLFFSGMMESGCLTNGKRQTAFLCVQRATVDCVNMRQSHCRRTIRLEFRTKYV